MTGRQKRELLILIAVVAIALVAGSIFRSFSGNKAPEATQPTQRPRVAATVNGAEILSGDVDKYYKATLSMLDMEDDEMPAQMRQEVRRTSLAQIIDETLLIKGAEARGISVTGEEVDSFIDSEMKTGFPNEKEFLESLEADVGFNLDDLRKMVRPWIAKEKMLVLLAADLEVTDEEVDAELEAYREMMKDHPGGEVPLPPREEVAAVLLERKAESEYEIWLDMLLAEADIEILDPELRSPEPERGTSVAASEESGEQNHNGHLDTGAHPGETAK